MSMSTRSPVAVQIPPQGGDRPSWVKVGVIAVVGFAVGVAWPRLAGIRPGPSAPTDVAAATATGTRANDAPPASALAPVTAAGGSAAQGAQAGAMASAAGTTPPSVSPPSSAPAAATPAVLVTRGAVISCKSQEGESLKGSACGGVPMFDAIAQPRLKRLAQCPGAAVASGKLAVLFSLDFARNKINFSFGKTSTVENKDSLDQCLRMALDKVSINAVDHEQSLYAVFYSVTFTPRDSASTPVPVANANASMTNTGGAVATPSALSPASASGSSDATAQVAWEVAIVRDMPRTGNVIARLQRGTKVRLGSGSGQEGWYKVQYGANFGSEGWVYRGSIGK
jgi:hypothetical protein